MYGHKLPLSNAGQSGAGQGIAVWGGLDRAGQVVRLED